MLHNIKFTFSFLEIITGFTFATLCYFIYHQNKQIEMLTNSIDKLQDQLLEVKIASERSLSEITKMKELAKASSDLQDAAFIVSNNTGNLKTGLTVVIGCICASFIL